MMVCAFHLLLTYRESLWSLHATFIVVVTVVRFPSPKESHTPAYVICLDEFDQKTDRDNYRKRRSKGK